MTSEDIVEQSSFEMEARYKDVTPIKRDIDYNSIKGIKKAGSEIKEYLQQTAGTDNNVVGGSTATYVQTKKFRRPGDVDVHTHAMMKTVHNFKRILGNKYGATNIVVEPLKIITLGKEQTKLIRIKIRDAKGVMHEAIDVKSKSDATMPFMDFSASAIRIRVKPVVVNGIKYESIQELVRRKAALVREKYVDRVRAGQPPRSRARKDIDDLLSIHSNYFPNDPAARSMKDNLTHYKAIPSTDEEEFDVPPGLMTRNPKKTPFGLESFML